MKKALLGTSAIAGAVALAAGSAYAGEAPQVTFSGALAYEFILNDGGQEAAGTGAHISANEQQSEFVWDARGTADNGLEYGANIQWRWARGDHNFDESWIDFRGSFGRIFLGGEDSVVDLVAGTAGHSVQVGTWGTDGNNALRHVNFQGLDTGLLYYQSSAGHTSDANKVGYVTPNFAGFQGGISFTPDGGQEQAVSSDDGATEKATDVAIGWGGDLGGVSLKADFGYQWASDEAGTGGAEQEDIGSYMAGAMASIAGFSIAAGYVENDDSGCASAVVNCDDGWGANVGVSYNFGAGGVSAMYQTGAQDTDGDGGYDKVNITHVGTSYTIAEGLSAYANYYYFDIIADGGIGGGATAGNHANVLIVGSRVTF